MGLASVDAEQERLLRERDQAEGRQAVLAALKSQIEQWQVCLQKINTEQHQHEELIQKQKELAARLAEEKALPAGQPGDVPGLCRAFRRKIGTPPSPGSGSEETTGFG